MKSVHYNRDKTAERLLSLLHNLENSFQVLDNTEIPGFRSDTNFVIFSHAHTLKKKRVIFII